MHFKYCLGIDVAKRRHQGAIVDAEGNVVLRGVSFLNTWDGFQKLMSATARLGPPSQFLCGMESTGHYWLNLYYALKEHGFHTEVINPLSTAHISQGHIRKTKTDPASAGWSSPTNFASHITSPPWFPMSTPSVFGNSPVCAGSCPPWAAT